MTPNQVVAYNLRRARLESRLTQREAAQLLARHLGPKWSTATFSLAECSTHRADRIRNFTADDIVALARAFDKPVEWFFQEPTPFCPNCGAALEGSEP